MNINKYLVLKVENNKVFEVEEAVCSEEIFSLYLNDKFIVNLIASPDRVEEFGAGYVVCEGLANNIRGVKFSNNKIYIYAKETREFHPELRSSGCIGTQAAEIKKVNSDIKIDARDIHEFAGALESEPWRKTGCFHCSALFCNKELITKSCDIGRHNTIDKVVGYAALNNIDLTRCVIACTGRQPRGMIFKVANAGIPVVISRAAPTDKGILAAKEARISLICFARGNKFNVYSHAERINFSTI